MRRRPSTSRTGRRTSSPRPTPRQVAELSVSNINDTTAYFDDEWVVKNTQLLETAYQDWKTQ